METMFGAAEVLYFIENKFDCSREVKNGHSTDRSGRGFLHILLLHANRKVNFQLQDCLYVYLP